MPDISMRMTLSEDVSSKLRSVSNYARSVASEMSSAGRAIDSAFKTSSPSAFASAVGSAMNTAIGDAESLGSALDSAVDGISSINTGDFNSIGSALSEATDSAEDFSDGASEAAESVEQLADAADGLEGGLDGLGEGADGLQGLGNEAEQAGNSMEDASGKAINFGNALKALFAVVSSAAIIHGVSDFAKESIALGENYTSMMSEVQALSGATGAEYAQLEQTAREYGATTVFSATEAAEALKYMSLAGWDASQSSAALGGVLDLAASSGMGLGEASDMVTDYLSAFGMEANQATYLADVLAYAQANSNTSAQQLGEAYKNSAANMHAAGQDVETTTSLLEAMANQGYKGAVAGTALAATMRDITQKMDDGAIKIGDTSVAVMDSAGNFRDLTDILIDVEAATEGMGDAEKATALSSTFTSDSIKALNMILTEGMDNVAGYEEALRHADGAAKDMADTMNDNLAGDKANLNSAFEEMQLQVFEKMEEPLREGTQYLTNEVIPALTEWVPDAFETITRAVAHVGNAIRPLFETILKNPKAVAGTFSAMAAGFVAMKGVNTAIDIAGKVSSAGGLTGALGKLSTVIFGNPWAAGAAAITAAVAGIGLAVHEYNEMKVDQNLQEHFGSIHLNDIQVDEVASQIVPVDITAQLEIAGTKFDDAEKLKSDAEEKLREIDTINWQINNVTGTISSEQGALLLENTEGFKEDVKKALENEEYAAELTVKAMLGSADSTEIVSQMQSWFAQDMDTISSLGDAVTDLLQKSIDDGAANVDTQTAITILQTKMLDMVNGAKQAELSGSLDWLMRSNPDAALDADSWASVITKAGEYQTSLIEAESDSYSKTFQYLDQLVHNDESRTGEVESIKDTLTTAFEQTKNATAVNVWEKACKSLESAYSTELETARDNLKESSQTFMDNVQRDLASASPDGEHLLNYLTNQGMIGGDLDGTTQKALADRYETLLPTVDQLKSVIDSAYGENGEQLHEIPTAIMNAYNQAMEIGAAAGDQDATYAYIARNIAESFGSKEDFVSALEAANVPFTSLPEALQEGVNRAFSETSDTMDYSQFLSDLTASLSGEDIDWKNVESILNQYGYSIKEALAKEGINIDDAEVKTEGTPHVNMDALGAGLEGLEYKGDITLETGVQLEVYEITSGDTLSGIAEKFGRTVQELAEANGISDVNEIEARVKIAIPPEGVEVDASAVGAAINDQLSSETETDTSMEVDAKADMNVTAGDVDASAAQESAQNELDNAFDASMPADGETDVTISESSNNISDVYGQVGNELAGAFKSHYSVNGYVDVSLNWNITNPTASIGVSVSGGSATATISSAQPHALGGIFDEPHLGLVAEAGPEAIIPLDGSQNAKNLWQEAGESLGFLQGDAPISVVPAKSSGGSSSDNEGKSVRRSVDININGNGRISASGGVSKEDVLAMLMEKAREVISNIIDEDILVEGEGAYEY